MEVVSVEHIPEDDYGLVIAWASVIAVILTWIVGVSMKPEALIALFNLIELLIDTLVDYSIFIF